MILAVESVVVGADAKFRSLASLLIFGPYFVSFRFLEQHPFDDIPERVLAIIESISSPISAVDE